MTNRWHLPLLALAVTLAATALASFADQWAYDHVQMAGTYDHAWAVALREIGSKYLYVWAAAALAVLAWEGWRKRTPLPQAGVRAAAVPAAALVAAGATFVLKHLAHRMRPPLEAGAKVTHLFDALFGAARHAAHDPALPAETFYSFPSGHTTIAFAGAFMLARLYPRTAALWLALAAGCALTRVLAHAHHLSDVVFAAGVGWFGAWAAAGLAARLGSQTGEKTGLRRK